jgi:hypothetical protein
MPKKSVITYSPESYCKFDWNDASFKFEIRYAEFSIVGRWIVTSATISSASMP